MSLRENVSDLASTVEALVSGGGDPTTKLDRSVDAIARAFDARTATLHRTDPSGSFLHLVVSHGLPEHVIALTRRIPVGKGMAGLCAQRREPVTVCNIQTDDSGTARPGARETGVAGAIVVPVFDKDRETLLGTLGIGMSGEHEYTDEEVRLLDACSRALASAVREYSVS